VDIPLPSSAELLAAELPVERVSVNSERTVVIYRYATEHAADTHLHEEARILGLHPATG
jgi:hypothetical protein